MQLCAKDSEEVAHKLEERERFPKLAVYKKIVKGRKLGEIATGRGMPQEAVCEGTAKANVAREYPYTRSEGAMAATRDVCGRVRRGESWQKAYVCRETAKR